ncbi:hypothetical protein E2C01_056493 [Portunus trituberculatus]|uniref:Uncharacterized protein n=1 Tax=Portunus trituberculatus TaxID=210409 RepID=A0A5B7GZR3_PORTR|nr:hypothetical protein [Portunus trituberculatus]
MARKRRFSGENKEPHLSTNGFTGITPDIFMDGDLSSDNLPPHLHTFPLLFYAVHHQPSLTVCNSLNYKK